MQLFNAVLTSQQMKDAGFSLRQPKEEGFNPRQLNDAGIGVRELRDANFMRDSCLMQKSLPGSCSRIDSLYSR